MSERALDSRPLDRIDLKILDALQADARMTNLELARRVALSPSACLTRVRRLEAEGVIAGYHAAVRPERFRPALMVFVEITVRQHLTEAFDRFDQALRGMPQVVEAFRVSGPIDYLLKVLVADIEEWRAVADRLMAETVGVEKMASHIVLAEAKPFEGFPIRSERPSQPR